MIPYVSVYVRHYLPPEGLGSRVHLGVYDGGPVGQDPGCESPRSMDAMGTGRWRRACACGKLGAWWLLGSEVGDILGNREGRVRLRMESTVPMSRDQLAMFSLSTEP